MPYHVAHDIPGQGFEQLRARNDGPALLWPSAHVTTTVAASVIAGEKDNGIPIFVRIPPESLVGRYVASQRGKSTRSGPIVDRDGNLVGSVWRGDDGSVLLPFDPDEVVRNCLTGRYALLSTGRATRALMTGARRVYYRTRPMLPPSTQIGLRRRFTRIQQRARFPRWPAKAALHDFGDLLFGILAKIASAPVPRIAAWPGGRTWAFVLTHDVETAGGYAALDPVLTLERGLGLRSAWYYVPRRYQIDIEDLLGLTAEGLEVGVHGLYHDGRDLASLALLGKRLPSIRDAADRWRAAGFRAPALHRLWGWIPLLGFDYETSYPDTDPYEPMPGGCCSWLPFFIGNVVELPVTLAQDHTIFRILGHVDEEVWVHKAQLLRDRGGMVLIDTHPDYLIEDRVCRAYRSFLERFDEDRDVWHALPCELSAWWRRRAGSSLERQGDGWHIVGPAAGEGRVEFWGELW